MLSLRRYAVYFGLVAVFLLTLSYFRDPIISRTRVDTGAQTPLARPPKTGNNGENAPQQTGDNGGNAPPQAGNTGGSAPPNNRFRWDSVSVRYPVKSLTPLPTEKPQKLPKVQYDFAPETAQHSTQRRRRQDAVKQTFERCWHAYRTRAWMHDELAPLSGGAHDGFGGWAANLVDNLDNLWIMGMRSEFEDAVDAVMEIDLSHATIDEINVFETTIRHVGGLLAAYDLSGDTRLVDKAREFGDMLIVAFDTPNRMPITRWRPQESLLGEAQHAHPNVLVAEIGSLTMEFTRLSQVTGDPKWYDAVERIVKVFEEQQYKTLLPGMWPVTVSGQEADFTQDSLFTLSAMSDSLYEYFPKMHALLGGVDPVYKKLYNGSMTTAIDHNLFRPMTPNNSDILVSGSIRVSSETLHPKLDPQGQHLVCFAGGMFALGGKLFGMPAHVNIGKKITDGCIWAYKALPLGMMPEIFRMVPCDSRNECEWNEEKWKAAVKTEYPDLTDPEEVIKQRRLPKGFTELADRRYILRPEAIESVFLLYRMTGEQYLQEAAWDMFTAIVNATETPLANAALRDISYTEEEVAAGESIQMDQMESFWMAETLKYFYLVFSEPDVISLDEWVFNTEAHPFKLPKAT